jgi:hypothetical protein
MMLSEALACLRSLGVAEVSKFRWFVDRKSSMKERSYSCWSHDIAKGVRGAVVGLERYEKK